MITSTGAGTSPLAAMLAERPMSRLQIFAVAISVALNALDGFDVLAITFAAPGIAKDWGIGPAQLGVALSSGLVGMALGSLLIAPFGDRHGRKPLILLCLLLMAGGMALTATATGLVSLCVWRVITGLGIGGMVATINAVAAEFANEKRRDFSVAVMTIGYPIGGLLGGFAVADLVEPYGWQSVFIFGAVATALFIPIVWFMLPESLEFLARIGSPEAHARIDALLDRMGHPRLGDNHAPPPDKARGGSFGELLGSRFRTLTLMLVAAYFLHIVTFYFFSGWLPKLMSDLGFSTPDAIRTSALMSLGGVIGGSVLGWAAPRLGLVRLVIAAMIATTVTFFVFGMFSDLAALQAISFIAGACVFGGIVGLYALLARAFPPELRVTGTGLAIGIGRAGAIVGPLVGGFLIAAGLRIPLAIAIIGTAALGAALILAFLPQAMKSVAR